MTDQELPFSFSSFLLAGASTASLGIAAFLCGPLQPGHVQPASKSPQKSGSQVGRSDGWPGAIAFTHRFDIIGKLKPLHSMIEKGRWSGTWSLLIVCNVESCSLAPAEEQCLGVPACSSCMCCSRVAAVARERRAGLINELQEIVSSLIAANDIVPLSKHLMAEVPANSFSR